jgi:hypothetical protein
MKYKLSQTEPQLHSISKLAHEKERPFLNLVNLPKKLLMTKCMFLMSCKPKFFSKRENS